MMSLRHTFALGLLLPAVASCFAEGQIAADTTNPDAGGGTGSGAAAGSGGAGAGGGGASGGTGNAGGSAGSSAGGSAGSTAGSAGVGANGGAAGNAGTGGSAGAGAGGTGGSAGTAGSAGTGGSAGSAGAGGTGGTGGAVGCVPGGDDCVAATLTTTIAPGDSREFELSLDTARPEAWFNVRFQASDSMGFQPKIEVLGDTGGNVHLSIYSDCSNSAPTCDEGGTSVAVTEFESTFVPTETVANPNVFIPTALGQTGVAHVKVTLVGAPGCYTVQAQSAAGCVAGATNCDAFAGCEANVNLDNDNCGSCGTVCGDANTDLAVCHAGTCFVECSPDFASCDNDDATGCESSLETDTTHCGSCAHDCTQEPLLGPSCVAGQCDGTCPPNTASCNTTLDDGCETDTTLPATCGDCNTACAPGFTCDGTTCRCTAGSCGNNGLCNTATGLCTCAAELCPAGDTCGSVSTCSSTCVATSCSAQGIDCGPATDLCGNSQTCPTCGSGETCFSDSCAPDCGPAAVINNGECPDSGQNFWCIDSNSCWTTAIDCWTAKDCTDNGVKDLACSCGSQVDCGGGTATCVAAADRPGCGATAVSDMTACPVAAQPFSCAVSTSCWQTAIDCSTAVDCSGDGTLDTACGCNSRVDCARPTGSRCVAW